MVSSPITRQYSSRAVSPQREASAARVSWNSPWAWVRPFELTLAPLELRVWRVVTSAPSVNRRMMRRWPHSPPQRAPPSADMAQAPLSKSVSTLVAPEASCSPSPITVMVPPLAMNRVARSTEMRTSTSSGARAGSVMTVVSS